MAAKQKTEILETCKRIWIALVYGVMSAVGVNMFLTHANSYSSGLLGLSQLLQTIFMLFHIHVSMSFLMAVFNVPLFIFAWRVFGMRRTHLRGKKKVETDVGIAFMMMNLSNIGTEDGQRTNLLYAKIKIGRKNDQSNSN